MTGAYDPAGHALLSDEAAALESSKLAAWGDAAERALGLAGTGFSGEEAETATLAVVHWINCQLKHRVGRVTAESKGSQSTRYSDKGDTDCTRAWDLVRMLGLPTLGTFEAASGLR